MSRQMSIKRPTTIVAAGLLVLALTGCGASSTPAASSTPVASSAPSSDPSSGASSGLSSGDPSAGLGSSIPPLASEDQYYVSIGDSYAAGYQATGTGQGHTTRNGFAYQVLPAARKKGYRFTLVNFGCSGATTKSVLISPGCPADLRGPGSPAYTQTQAAAAEAFLRAHQGKVGLITVSLGGNDVTGCAGSSDIASCLSQTLTRIKANLATLLRGLQSAAGQPTRIVGITYPDVFLGAATLGTASGRQLAAQSVLAFRTLINPQLKAAYAAVGATLVDVTRATGAYGSLTATTTLPPYGRIPVPVAKICRLTFFCEFQDIHPRTNGYAIIADLVVGTLPTR